MTLVTLKRRSDFLRIRGGARWGTPSVLLEGKRRIAVEPLPSARVGQCRKSVGDAPRFGLTVTKKLGSAVVRNRIRRRLREALRRDIAAMGLAGCDYVIVARDAALHRSTQALRDDLETALSRVNRRLASVPARR